MKLATEVFAILQQHNPEPRTALICTSPFELLIAVILSAQATDVKVNQATRELFKYANTPEQILALGAAKLKNHIKTIGLYNTKAKHILATCEILSTRYNSNVPANREALEQLPGVGRKTANVVLNAAFGKSTIAVDTHVFRVAKRIGLASGDSPLQVEQELLQHIPKRFQGQAHNWLIAHGRSTCTARQPKCERCVLCHLCKYAATCNALITEISPLLCN